MVDLPTLGTFIAVVPGLKAATQHS